MSDAESSPGRRRTTPSQALAPRPRGAPQRPGLGTEFGEARESHGTEASFERASSRPEALLTFRYDDWEGLLALGVDVDGERGHLP